MISQIELRDFKCFELLRLPLSPLTLLSGCNASGKSSVLQALVLLHQTMNEHEWSTRLMLNGSSIQLGTVCDVVDQVHGRRTFEIGVSDDDLTHLWTFSGERSDMSMAVERVTVAGTAIESPQVLRYLLRPEEDGSAPALASRLRALTYLTAERIGPREVYALKDPQISTVVGPDGEHAVSVLHLGRDEPVLCGLVREGVANTRLHQVEERMRVFFPDFAMQLRQVPQTNAVTLGLRTSPATEFLRPIHVGFGLTQILPIVIAALSAAEGDILVIENPEVHLHPAAQALMGQFLADVARAGVQVIVESHSDHVLNGIRRSVKAECLTPEQVVIHFFRPRTDEATQVLSPVLDSSGNIDSWPEGFFDQFDRDMNHFAGWGE